MLPGQPGILIVMGAQTLASRTVQLGWDRPRFELLDRRGAVLSALDGLDILDGFRTDGDSLAFHLAGGRSAEVDMRGMWVYELSSYPASSNFDVLLIIERVAEVLSAERVLPSVSFQHFVAWPPDSNYDAARIEGVASMVEAAADLGLYDFAMMTDGRTATGWDFQAEYGVIEASDAPLRLSRRLGRTSGQVPALDHELFDMDFPPVGTFVDSTWNRQRQSAVSLGTARALVEQLGGEANRTVAALHNNLLAHSEHAQS